MLLINRSPGAFMVFANLVVYGVIGAEIWMWTVASTAAVTATLVLIAACAGLICRSVLTLLDDGVDDDAPAVRATVTVPARVARDTAPAPARRRRPFVHHPA